MGAEILFAGGGLDSLSFTGGPFESTSTAASYDSAYARAATRMVDTASTVSATCIDSTGAAASIAGGRTAWLHFDCYKFVSWPTNVHLAMFYDSSGSPWLSLRATGSATCQMHYNSGTGGAPVWTPVGASFAVAASARHTFDIKVTIGAGGSHSFEVFRNSVSQTTGNFTQASFTNVRKVTFSNGDTNGLDLSQIMIAADLSTIGAKVAYKAASGPGNQNGWNGAYADINEAVASDATTLWTATAGQVASFAYGDIAVPTGLVPFSVFVASRVKNDGLSPVNMQHVIRTGGADRFSGNLPGIGASFGAAVSRHDTDPATGAAWTQSGFNAAEFGAKSIA